MPSVGRRGYGGGEGKRYGREEEGEEIRDGERKGKKKKDEKVKDGKLEEGEKGMGRQRKEKVMGK